MKADKQNFADEVFQVSPYIRYIAVYDHGQLFMKQRNTLVNTSSGESDKYEELLVNPTLLTLASQRGNIDCGGLDYLIIRYGHFFVFLIPTENGHVNFGIEHEADVFAIIGQLRGLLNNYGYI